MSLQKILTLTRNPSKNIRLYFISGKKHYFINAGAINPGFEDSIKILKSRESIMNEFSKMSFIFDEIIRLRIVGYYNDSRSKELLYLLNLVPVNRKIRTFLDWKVFDPEYTREMSRLFEVRNDTVHSITLNDITYNPQKPLLLSSQKGFSTFKKNFENAWIKLIKIYKKEQDKINLEKFSRDLAA